VSRAATGRRVRFDTLDESVGASSGDHGGTHGYVSAEAGGDRGGTYGTTAAAAAAGPGERPTRGVSETPDRHSARSDDGRVSACAGTPCVIHSMRRGWVAHSCPRIRARLSTVTLLLQSTSAGAQESARSRSYSAAAAAEPARSDPGLHFTRDVHNRLATGSAQYLAPLIAFQVRALPRWFACVVVCVCVKRCVRVCVLVFVCVCQALLACFLAYVCICVCIFVGRRACVCFCV
jgi:hypothetical protein